QLGLDDQGVRVNHKLLDVLLPAIGSAELRSIQVVKNDLGSRQRDPAHGPLPAVQRAGSDRLSAVADETNVVRIRARSRALHELVGRSLPRRPIDMFQLREPPRSLTIGNPSEKLACELARPDAGSFRSLLPQPRGHAPQFFPFGAEPLIVRRILRAAN